jgi:hypothetical protein
MKEATTSEGSDGALDPVFGAEDCGALSTALVAAPSLPVSMWSESFSGSLGLVGGGGSAPSLLWIVSGFPRGVTGAGVLVGNPESTVG